MEAKHVPSLKRVIRWEQDRYGDMRETPNGRWADVSVLESWSENIDKDQQTIKELKEALEGVKKYHEWVMKECVWHLEANAQIGLVRLLKDVEAALAKANEGEK